MNIARRIVLLALFGLLGACAPQSKAPSAEADAAAPLPKLVVYKSPTCGCCSLWVQHMERAGFPTETHDVENLNSIKSDAGIPAGMGSCHTARVGEYFIEGHVPAADVKRLLRERPNARGLTVPRMPVGSPGMETPSGEVEPYDVYLVHADGTSSVYAHHEK